MPDRHGFCSLGTSVEAMHAAIRAAKTVIVQFNRAMPRTLGESFIHVDDIDLAVEVDVPPYEHRTGEIGDVERRIGEHVADLIPDGATLQLGIGAIPSAVALALGDKRDLGVHTEMFTDAIVDLVEAGVVTGARKERNRGKIVTAFMMGTQRLYDFVHDNPMVEMRSVDFTNDTHVIRSFSRMMAINSAIEVRPHGPGGRRLDRTPPLQRRRRPDGLHPRRGPGRARVGRSSPCRRPRPAGPARGSRPPSRRGGRRHDAGPRADRRDGVGGGRAVRAETSERAAALIEIAHPDFRDQLRADARVAYGR